MGIEYMRNMILDVYHSDTWKNKVKNMTNNQVIAIYNSFLKKGKFKGKKNDNKQEYKQITIFEYMAQKGNK